MVVAGFPACLSGQGGRLESLLPPIRRLSAWESDDLWGRGAQHDGRVFRSTARPGVAPLADRYLAVHPPGAVRALPAPAPARARRHRELPARYGVAPAVDPAAAHPLRRRLRAGRRGGDRRPLRARATSRRSTDRRGARPTTTRRSRRGARPCRRAAPRPLPAAPGRSSSAAGTSAATWISCAWSATPTACCTSLIADMKSSTSAKVEHRLQVAFYAEMLDALFAHAGVAYAEIAIAMLYRGPADGRRATIARRRASAAGAPRTGYFGGGVGLPGDRRRTRRYRGAVHDLVTGPRLDGAARRRDALRRHPLPPRPTSATAASTTSSA